MEYKKLISDIGQTPLGEFHGDASIGEANIGANVLRRARERNQYYESDLFSELMKSLPATSLEVMPIHIDNESNVNFYLTQRDSNDPIEDWKGKWHGPGVMVMNYHVSEDTSLRLAWEKLNRSELENKATGVPLELINRQLMVGSRGCETARIHSVLVPGNLTKGRYFKVHELEKLDLIAHHKVILANVFNTLPHVIKEGRLNLPSVDQDKVLDQLDEARKMFDLHTK